MSVKRDVRQLERAREEELARLCGRIETLADSVENGPARWVGEHPYMAVAGAAVTGFLTAQFARGSGKTADKPRPAARKAPPRPEARVEEDGAAGAHGGGWIEILTLLANQLAEPLFRAPRKEDPGSVRVGDGGTVKGGRFPGAFAVSESPAVSASR